MKHISDLTTLPSQGYTEQQRPSLTEKATAKLWRLMTEMYGHRWISSYGEKDSGTWAKGLAGLTGQQLAQGVRNCFERDSVWPPSLPEFRAMCLHTPTQENAKMYKTYKALPKPKCNQEIANASISKMRKLIFGSDHTECDEHTTQQAETQS